MKNPNNLTAATEYVKRHFHGPRKERRELARMIAKDAHGMNVPVKQVIARVEQEMGRGA